MLPIQSIEVFFRPLEPPSPILFPQRPEGESISGFVSNECVESGFGASQIAAADDGDDVTVAAIGIPMWLVATSMSIPFAALVAILVFQFMKNGRVDVLLIPAFVIFPLACGGFLMLIRALNQRMRAGVVRARVNRNDATLELPDYDVVLQPSTAAQFILAKGWQSKRDGKSSTSTWATELSVIGHDEDGQWWRWPVVSGCGRRLEGFAEEASRTFNIPLIRIRGDQRRDLAPLPGCDDLVGDR